jgi:hypothetical protein
MNYIKETFINPVNNYVFTPVNEYVVDPVITRPINKYLVNPIQKLVNPETPDIDTVQDTYTTFDSFQSDESVSLLNNEEVNETTYLEHLRYRMYCSGLSLKASFYFFINGWFPNTLKDEGYNTLEYLKKND